MTNDVAERGIAMIQAFAHTVKDKEAQLQWLLLEMEAHWRSLKFDKRSLAIVYVICRRETKPCSYMYAMLKNDTNF